MSKDCVLAIDQGTTGTTLLVVDAAGQAIGRAYAEIAQHYPQPGWVEHDPEEIWRVTRDAVCRALADARAAGRVAAVGITNQRETTILWDAASGEPIHRAIVWQCRRTAPLCERLRAEGAEAEVRERTGLVIDPYFSGTKVQWLLDHVDGARRAAEEGKLRFGTVDSWLLWKLTDGAAHKTDFTNASRTMLFNLRSLAWDARMLELLGIPAGILPQALPSAAPFGEVAAIPELRGVPVLGIAGDQQAALFGQCGFAAGSAKNTYGTGCFLLLHTGEEPVASKSGLLTTVACSAGPVGAALRGRPGQPLRAAPTGVSGERAYALEGSVFIAGAVVQWLRDGLGLIRSAAETAAMARSVPDSGGVVFVPAFVGLGAPHWDAEARGAIFGLTRGARAAHLVRAALESIAFQTMDVVDAMDAEAEMPLTELLVDGGASANDFLMQFQADLLDRPVVRPGLVETTAMGAAFLAGLAAGVWPRAADLRALRRTGRTFSPAISASERDALRARWREAVRRTLTHRG